MGRLSGRRQRSPWGPASAGPPAAGEQSVIWHDVECAAYDVDLPLWRELAAERSGVVLDLGCGTGRVALDLAARGHEVTGVDADPALVRELCARARAGGLPVTGRTGDARSFELGRTFGLAISPMQVLQLLGGAPGREAALARVRRHLESGGLFAAALADPFEGTGVEDLLPPLPDVRELSGWLFQSAPVAVRDEGGATAIDRLRHTVAPDGTISESLYTVRLDNVGASEVERTAERVGFRALERREVPATDVYVGSVVVMLEAA